MGFFDRRQKCVQLCLNCIICLCPSSVHLCIHSPTWNVAPPPIRATWCQSKHFVNFWTSFSLDTIDWNRVKSINDDMIIMCISLIYRRFMIYDSITSFYCCGEEYRLCKRKLKGNELNKKIWEERKRNKCPIECSTRSSMGHLSDLELPTVQSCVILMVTFFKIRNRVDRNIRNCIKN